MTLNEFFRELRKARLEWRIDFSGMIREVYAIKHYKTDNKARWIMTYRCPICALAKVKTGQEVINIQFAKAASILGLSRSDAQAIASASDFVLVDSRMISLKPLRRRILQVCDLLDSRRGIRK